MSKTMLQTECKQCGQCCMKGGPALHSEDKRLLLQKYINRESLISIRKGEPIFSLEGDKPELAQTELIKLKGRDTQWSCIFYNQELSSCSIYQHRPLECILLKCWDTSALKAIAGKKLLNRFDIISPNEPVVNYIHRHEKVCDLEILDQLSITKSRNINTSTLAELTGLVNRDLALRSEAVMDLDLNLDLELFYFGRPLFKILSQFSLIPKEENGRIILFRS